MKNFIYTIIVLILSNYLLYSQSGTFDFDTGASQSGDPITVTQTKSGVTLTVSASAVLNDDVALYDWGAEDGTSGYTVSNAWGGGETMVLTFNATVNITMLRVGEYEDTSYTLRFTPNTGSYVDASINGLTGTDVTLNFVGITTITITRISIGTTTISLMLDNIVMDGSLPVELTSFSALIKNNEARLNWRTATELNNYGFEVEKIVGSSRFATDGQSPNIWVKIGFVQGNGNSNSPKEYFFVDSNPHTGKSYYRLKMIDIDGSFEYSEIVEVSFNLTLSTFELFQNYPNPFNPETVISYQLSENSFVTLKVFDVLGKEVVTLVNEVKEAGQHKIKFDASKLSSGMYLYKLQTGGFILMKKMLLLK